MALKPLSGLFTPPTAPKPAKPTQTTPTLESSTCQLSRVYSQPLETPNWGAPINKNEQYRDVLPWLA